MRSEFGNYEEETLGKAYDLKLIRRLLPFIVPYRVIFYACVFLMVLITALDLSIPYLTKIAIDRYIVPVYGDIKGSGSDQQSGKEREIRVDIKDPVTAEIVNRNASLFIIKGDTGHITLMKYKNLSENDRGALRKNDLAGLYRIAGLLLVVILLHFIFNFIQKLVMEYAGQKIMHDLRMALFDHIQTLSVSFFNRNPVGRLVTRVTNDVQNMHEMFTSVIIFLFKDLFLILGIAIVLSAISIKLAMISFVVLPFVVFASFYFARHARDVFRELRVKVAQINTRFSETIQGMKIIQLFRHEIENHRRFRELNHENYLAGMRQIHIFAVFMPVIEVLGSIALAIIIFYGGRGVVSETVTLGALVAFISYMKMFFRPVRDIAEKYNILQNSLASAERIFLILDETDQLEPDYRNDKAGGQGAGTIQTIEFSDVSFSYTPSEPVLKNISFHLNKGDTMAVVGPTGAGKTSLINLIVRYYDPLSGEIRINGRDIRQLDLRSVRSRTALVTQDPFLFSGTIRENITGNSETTRRYDMDQILDTSNCHTFVNRLPHGVDTRLSEGAKTLSSGERQLISIARAIASDPDLIILDEATSYIDTESEVRIQEALDNLMASRTSVIIAHRISTARNADTILVLNRGRIVESGNHDALMERRGLYWRLNMMKG